jgi:hypothetical protein
VREAGQGHLGDGALDGVEYPLLVVTEGAAAHAREVHGDAAAMMQ